MSSNHVEGTKMKNSIDTIYVTEVVKSLSIVIKIQSLPRLVIVNLDILPCSVTYDL